jgi:hypothetical protein
MGCASSQPEVTVEHVAALQARVAEMERCLEQKNIESATYQHELVCKALVETSESATGELGKLNELVQSMRVAKQAMEDIQNTTSAVQEFMPATQLVDDQEYRVTQLSLVVFQGKGSCGVTVTPLTGNRYTVDNMIDYRNARMGGCALAQPGDTVKFKSYDPPEATAYMVAMKT